MSAQHEHDDFGGLHRDLVHTGCGDGPAATASCCRALRRGHGRLAAPGRTNAGALTDTGTTDSGGTINPTTCSKVPSETAGPFPGDGSNGANALNATGVVRSDIRTSFAGLSGTAVGIPLTISLTVVSATTCAPLANRAVYICHCNRAGLYSLYSSGVTN